MYGCWAYDSFGNRTANDPLWTTACPAQESSLTPTDTYNTNNQMDPLTKSYDPSGNMTVDNATGNTYLYDGEGRICAVSSTPAPGFTTMTGYVYDADGNRVAKGTITSMSCDPSVNGIATANNETDYILGPGGEQVTELAQDANGSMNWQRSYVYAGGLIATYDPNPDNPSQPLPSFRLTDWLGTMRATTDSYGVAQGTCTGLPFGDGVTCSGDIPDNHHFTGKERDAESGNDYFGARYYASSMGRFMSPDWSAQEEPVPYAKMDDPQSLNLYAYLRDNPLAGVDADGHGGAERAKQEPGDQPCSGVMVQATVTEQPKIEKNTPVENSDGKVIGHGTGPTGGQLTDTVTVNGKPAEGVGVAEKNVVQDTKNGVVQPGSLNENRSAVPTDSNGQIVDNISMQKHAAGTAQGDNAIVEDMSTNVYTSTDKQTLTLTNIPGVGTCTATSTRVMTNAGADGQPSSTYTLRTTQPVVRDTQN
jgi:RHS repeat-associated protein